MKLKESDLSANARRTFPGRWFAAAMAVLMITVPNQAPAAPGDLIAIVPLPAGAQGSGVSVAVDCSGNVYFTSDVGDRLYTMDKAGTLLNTVTIRDAATGQPLAINEMAWDESRRVLWALQYAVAPERIHQIDPATGIASFQFSAVQTPDNGSYADGVAFDGSDDSLWVSSDGSSTIEHYWLDGTFIEQITPRDASGNVLGSISGVVVGAGDLLYLARDGLSQIVRVRKSNGAFIGAFASVGNVRDEGLECDAVNFAPRLALWSRDYGSPGRMAVIEIEPGTCECGAGYPSTNEPPLIVLQPASQAVLAGQTVTLSATVRGSRPLSLQWLFNGQPLTGATNASLILSSVTTNQAGGYKLVASNALGVATSARATLAVSLQGPHITLHPSSRSALAGEDVTFSVLATGGPLFYQWRLNGVDLPDATNATLFLTAVTTNNAGTYQVAVSNLLGYVTSLPATLTVNQFAPRITSQPFDQSVQSGDNVQFYVGAEAAPPAVYQWRFNGVDLPGETNATLLLANVTTNLAGRYTVLVSNSVGSVTSQPAMLTVNEFPPSITFQPFNQTVSAGSDVSFSVGVNGSPPLTFQWRLNGTNLPGATNATLFLPAVHPNRAGVYTVAVSNHLGFVISLPAVLTVVGGAAPVITSQPANLTLLAGGSGNLIVIATGQPAPAYQWRRNGVDLPGASSSVLAFVNIATNQSGNYSVVVSNLFSAVTSRVAVVTVNLQAPNISSQPASRTVEAGATVVFTVTASGGPPPSYQWLFNGEVLPGAEGSSLVLNNVFTNQAGIYSVIVSNEVGVVVSASATLTVNAAAPIITTQPASRTVLDGSNATFVVSATGVPQVTFQWRFHATGAAGGVDLPGRNSSVLSLTSVSTNAAGEYTVVVSNLVGVVVSEPAILTVTQQAPVITAQTTNRTVFVGANVIFQVLAVAGPRPTYQWQRDGVNITGANNSSLVLSNVSRADEGNYAVVVSNPLGSVTSQPMRLTVRYQPPVITGNPTNRSVLAGNSASFTVTATGSLPLFYQWRFNGANLPGATDQTLVLTAVMTNQGGAYSCLVTNFGGATTSSVATLTVTVQPPTITTQPANRTVPGGTNVTFSVVASGAPSPTYQWRFNGVELAGATNAQLTLINVGTNNAGGYSVFVSNPFGSVTSRVATLTIIVQPTVITVQPVNRTARLGGSVTFSVNVTGTPPLLYQWDFNGGDIPGATNATLTLTGLTHDNEGSYRVTINGAGGTVVSRKAELSVREPTSGDFRITALLPSNSRVVEHNFVTGDDRGGIATSSTRVFYSGDSQTAGFALADLSGATGVGRIFDALVGDLNSETIYSLGNGANPLGGGGTVTTLIELNGVTGQPTANVITLSEPIDMQGGSGLFAGYDQVALFNGARVYTIEVSSGLVIDHGPFSMPPHSTCENWAFWGVAEQIDGELHLAYVRDSQTIAHVRVTDGFVESIATFASLSDMCSFTLSLPLNRWYFHHEGNSQFGGGDESIGYADATWEVSLPGPPIIRQQPQNLTALAGYAAQFSVAATGARPLSYQWRFNDTDLPGATNQALSFTPVATNNAGGYTVVVANALGAVTSQVATLTVELVAPSILAQPIGRSAFEGARVSFSVIATGAPPPFYQWQFNGADIAGATNPVFTLAQVTTNDAGNYRVLVSNLAGSVTSDSANLAVRLRTNAVSVLLIWDVVNSNTLSLRDALEAAGIQVELSETSEDGYDGTNPRPDEFGAVIHLNGTTYNADMPLAGQNALVQYVQEGGGYLQSEWDAYEISQGRMSQMRDLTLFDRDDAYRGGDNTWVIVPEQAGHPVVANVPASFTFRTDFHFSPAHVFATDPATVLMRDPDGHDAVAVREFAFGRIVGFQHVGNYDGGPPPPYNTLANPNIQQLYIDGVFWAAGGSVPDLPPSISAPPANRTVALGRTATFQVGARGTRPLSYQWRFNGIDLSGETNVTLVISNAAFSQAGNYAVVVANAFGSVTSAPALLSVIDVPANAEFRITSLTADNSHVAEHDFLTGDDRGGIAVSDSHVFYTGDSSTARFALGDLSGGTSLGRQYDAMVSNLRTETVYSLANGTTPIPYGGGTVTTLIEIDGATGELTANTIALSTPINVNNQTNEAGIFAGYDQVVLLTEGRAYSIHLPTGIVTDLGPMTIPEHQGCENWAFWGVAENFDGAVHLVYVRDSQTIARARVPDGATEVLATFDNLSDMCSFTMSLSLNRWYFHHEGGSQFGGNAETIGFADATWEFPVPPSPPTITQGPQSVNGLWGGSALFQVAASGSLLSYQWLFNGAPLPGASASTLLLSNLASDDAGSYAVIVRNPFGAVTSAPVALTVSALAPTVTTPPVSQTVVLGVDVLFVAEISAAPQAALQWFFNNAALPGATNATLLLTNVTMNAAGSYRVVADNFAGSAISPVATLTVIPQVPLPVALDTPGQEWTTGGDALWVGQPFTTHDGVDAAQNGFLFDDEQSWVQTSVTGPGQVSFWWKVSSEAGYDFAQFTIGGGAQAAISGEVDWQQRTISFPAGPQILRWAYVKDGSFHEGADRAWLDEVRFEIAPRIVTPPASRKVAEGGTATFTVVAEGSAPLSYQWRKNGVPISQATNASLTLANVQPNDTGGVYSVVVRNAYGSVTSSNATLTVVTIAPLVVGISNGGNQEERNALSTTLTNLGFVVRFVSQGQWAGLDVVVSYPGDGIGPGVSEISTGVNYIQISDHGSDWTPNSWNSVTEGATITIRVDTAHPITTGLAASWTARGFWRYGYFSEDFVGWSDDVALPSLASETQRVNHSRVLVANSLGDGRAVYVGWNVYGPDAGTNDRTLLRNAVSWAAGTPIVPTPPLIVQQPGSQTVAAGSAASFTVVAGGSTPLFYQWQLNGTAIPGATNQTIALDYVLPADAGDYTVVVSNQLGSVTSAPATLTVTVQAPVITAQPASQAVLGGGCVTFSVTATGVPAPTYQWRLNGADISGATNSTLVLNNVTAADAGTYKVIVRNFAGTATSLPARLTVNILAPQITLQPASQSVLRGTNATFTVAATGAPAPTYQWRFNDTDLAGETNPSLTIRQPTAANAGHYTVRVSNSGGAVISLAAELMVVESIALAEALDLPGLLWRSGGAVPWFGQPMISHDGSDAASSGGIGDSRESWLETTVTGPGTVSFWWKVSSELGFDRLNFSVGNQPLATISGETDWQALSFPVSDGPQTLRWSYGKDGSARDGADAGWLDQVVVTTSPALVVHAAIVGADVRISFPAAPGRRYRIERANDLTHSIEWLPVAGAENLLGTGLTLEMLDVGGAEFAQRFYRVTLLP